MSRRAFLIFVGTLLVAPKFARSQQGAPASGATSNLFDMDQSAAKTTRRPPKPGASASMSDADRDELEHHIHCQCGCTLDVYVCRTTDFSCQVSPAMHRDVMALVAGGYSAQEILDAFVQTYGERALMAPRKSGFNWAGYVVPFAALAGGAALVLGFLKRTRSRAPLSAAAATSLPVASSDEMARLEAAIRRDD